MDSNKGQAGGLKTRKCFISLLWFGWAFFFPLPAAGALLTVHGGLQKADEPARVRQGRQDQERSDFRKNSAFRMTEASIVGVQSTKNDAFQEWWRSPASELKEELGTLPGHGLEWTSTWPLISRNAGSHSRMRECKMVQSLG